ncbi:MAG: hypothetical protein AB7I25_02415 [Vicinamibacterales bacterium]
MRARLAVVLLACGVSVVGLQAARERFGQIPEVRTAPVLIRSAALIGRASLSYRPLVADIYWLRTLQHYGRTKLSTDPHKQYDLLEPLLDLTTSLDPRFNAAYRFGAIFLAEPFPDGPGRPDQAIALLEKGLREQPGKWEYIYDIGFVEYLWRGNHREAARRFQDAAAHGGPNWLGPLAAVTLAKGGDRRASRMLWQQVRASADVDWLARSADHRLAQLDALDQLDRLNTAVDQASLRLGRAPANWHDVVAAGVLRGIPLDPTGVPYQLGAGGRVGLGRASTLNPLPVFGSQP